MTQDGFAPSRPAAPQPPALSLPDMPGMPTCAYCSALVPAVDYGLLPRGAPV